MKQAYENISKKEAEIEDIANEIRTQFVADRLKEATYEERDWIAELVVWERMDVHRHADGDRALGFAGNMYYRSFRRAYPVECRCIQQELHEGIYTSTEAYRRCAAEREAEEERQRREAERDRQVREEAMRRIWLKFGGRQ